VQLLLSAKIFGTILIILFFSRVRREINQATHYLVKYVISISSYVVWIKETPSCIDALL